MLVLCRHLFDPRSSTSPTRRHLYDGILPQQSPRAEQTPTLIDLILTSEGGMVNNIVHDAPLGKSHHQVLKFENRTSVQSKERSQDTRLIYSRADFDGWREYIRKLNMSDRLQDMDVMEGWKSFLDTYNQALDRYVPKAGGNLKSKTPRRKQPLWMNEKALSKFKKQKAAFARYVQTREGKDYAKARNQAGAECKRAIKQYEKSRPTKQRVIQKHSTPTLTARSKQGIAELIDEKGNTATSNKDKADTLNRSFCSVFTQEDVNEVPQCEKRKISSGLTNVIFTREEIRRKLEKLDPGKSPGPDGLHSRTLKELAEEIAPFHNIHKVNGGRKIAKNMERCHNYLNFQKRRQL